MQSIYNDLNVEFYSLVITVDGSGISWSFYFCIGGESDRSFIESPACLFGIHVWINYVKHNDHCLDYVLFIMSMSSDEVNFLVYRYLQESGKFTYRNINQSMDRIITLGKFEIYISAFCPLISHCFRSQWPKFVPKSFIKFMLIADFTSKILITLFKTPIIEF